jgi:hypothetical protein
VLKVALPVHSLNNDRSRVTLERNRGMARSGDDSELANSLFGSL